MMSIYKSTVRIVIFVSIFIVSGCSKVDIGSSTKSVKSQVKKYESPVTLNMSYTTNNSGNYYILVILVSKENTPYASFELDVPDKFITRGSKKWSGEIESNIPKILEFEILRTFTGKEITGVFTVSIKGNIFTVNQILNLGKIEKPAQGIFRDKKNEKGEKIADYKVRR